MDDPDAIPNSSGGEVDPVKRTIILGVVNTSGMKSGATSASRKRRWDQPPDQSEEEGSGGKKAAFVKEASERLTADDEPDSTELLDAVSYVNDVGVADSDGSVQVPANNVSERLSHPPGDDSVSEIVYDGHSEAPSGTSLLDCDGEETSPPSTDLRIDKLDDAPSEKSKTKKENKSTTVVSHQSEALRGIMFSYDASDSEASDSDSLSNDGPAADTNQVDSGKCNNISGNDQVQSTTHIGNNSLETTSIDSSTLNDVEVLKVSDSSISKKTESHPNIPNSVANDLSSVAPEVNCISSPPLVKHVNDSRALSERRLSDSIAEERLSPTVDRESNQVNELSDNMKSEILESKGSSKSDIAEDEVSKVVNEEVPLEIDAFSSNNENKVEDNSTPTTYSKVPINDTGVGEPSRANVDSSISIPDAAIPSANSISKSYPSSPLEMNKSENPTESSTFRENVDSFETSSVNNIDPKVMKVILGTSDDASAGASSLKDEESSLGPSLCDSESNGGATYVTCDDKTMDLEFSDFTVNITSGSESNSSKVFVKTSVEPDALEEKIVIQEVDKVIVQDDVLLPDKVESPSFISEPVESVNVPLIEDVTELLPSDVPSPFAEFVTKSPLVEEVVEPPFADVVEGATSKVEIPEPFLDDITFKKVIVTEEILESEEAAPTALVDAMSESVEGFSEAVLEEEVLESVVEDAVQSLPNEELTESPLVEEAGVTALEKDELVSALGEIPLAFDDLNKPTDEGIENSSVVDENQDTMQAPRLPTISTGPGSAVVEVTEEIFETTTVDVTDSDLLEDVPDVSIGKEEESLKRVTDEELLDKTEVAGAEDEVDDVSVLRESASMVLPPEEKTGHISPVEEQEIVESPKKVIDHNPKSSMDSIQASTPQADPSKPAEDQINSSDAPVVKESEDNSKDSTEEIVESFDVIEEVVTCESEKVIESEVEEVMNEEENARFASEELTEETQESVESAADDLVAVTTDNDTSDLKVSINDNQNVVVIDSTLVNAEENSSSDLLGEASSKPIENSINSKFPISEKMESEPIVNSCNTAVPDVEEMEVDEAPASSAAQIQLKSHKSDSSSEEIPSNNIPLLKTVLNPHTKSKIAPTPGEDPWPSQSETRAAARLEPITLKIYKDNLTIKTDGLDSPKKHRSPKTQKSPSLRLNESTSSVSPENKQLEFTLKIAKDASTNIPRATMSPKRNMSPNSTWRLESGSSSPRSPGEGGIGTLKLKLSKPSSSTLVNDVASSSPKPSSTPMPESHRTPQSGKESGLLKASLEMGPALKMMIETEKSEEVKPRESGGSSLLEQALSSSSATPSRSSEATTTVKKRGRPRKEEAPPPPVPAPSSSPPPGSDDGDGQGLDTSGEDTPGSRSVRSCRARTLPIVAKARKSRGGGATPTTSLRGGGRGGARGVARPIATPEEAEKIQEKLSEKEKAELAKIAARREKMRLDRIAKNEAKKAKKLARKLKDDERARRRAAEKAAAAERAAAERAPQVFEEETRMSASESRGTTPAPLSRILPPHESMEESPSLTTASASGVKTGNHKGRMEIPIDPESDEVKVDGLAEYQWDGGELCMIQEQVSLYLGVKSFKRKYPDLKRRLVEAEERTFLEDSGLVPKAMCDLGLTAVSSAEILDIMYQDFPEKYEEFRQHVRDKQAKEMMSKQKALASQSQSARAKGELRELALEAAAMWNSSLNKERREERRCALDLQSLTVHYPRAERDRMAGPPLHPGLYPVAVIPGQFQDYYKTYTPTELMYFPLNTVMYGPLKPNQRRVGTDSSSSSSDETSSSSDEEEEEESASKECKICNGEKKTTNEAVPEILLQCSSCQGLCHPTCQEITPEMLPHIKKYSWHCSNCKKCMQCKDATKEEKMLFCDLCDRGYHLSCASLEKAPEGRWHCSVCSYCTSCGTKDPGGAEWFYDYKKTDKGVRLYQRTLCVPCSKNAAM